MDITFRLPGPWGPGKGTNLAPAEVDNNFWSLVQAIVDLQNDPSQPVGIASISVSGTQMTITLTDGTVMGPFTLPVLTFRWRGEWQPDTAYAELDVFSVTDTGIFMVLVDHTSGSVFDPVLVVGGLAAYLQLFGSTDARLSALSDVEILDPLLDGDALIWGGSKWNNLALGSMAYQAREAVSITGGSITGMLSPVNPTDVVNKAYVDALPAGMTSATGTMMSNISGGIAAAIPNTLSDYLDVVLGSNVRGTLMYRGAPGWTALPPGTAGLFLMTHAAGSDPTWEVGASGVTSISAGAGITTGAGPIVATGSVALAAIADNSLLANVSGTTAAPSATTLSAILDRVMSSTRGSVLMRAGSGWVALAPGTAGYFLQTQGSTADPQWASPAGAGTVTSVSAGTGITTGGAPITGAGTVSLAAIANLSVLANISGGSAAPLPATATALFDALFGATQGAVLYRSASAWAMLSPGTAGQVLTTGGAAANPAWANAAAGAPIANLLLLANISGATAAASGNTLSNILDAVISSSRGTLLYRGASGWVGLAPGTTGQLLQTGGAAGDPSWVTGATGGGGASITTSDTPPASPADGDAWWDSVAGQLYISYADANSQQWVPASNQPGPAGPTGATGATGPAGSANMTGMTAGQIPIAANATSVTSSIPTTTFVARTGDTITGNLTINGGLASGATVSTGDASYELGQGRTGSGPAYIDLHAAAGTDFELRVYRAAGLNGQASINQGGTGGLDVLTNGVSRWTIDSGGLTTIAGGLGVGAAPIGGSIQCVYFAASENASGKNIYANVQGYKPGGGTWADSSDVRLKDDIADYTTGLAAVTALRPVSYTFNGKAETPNDGRTFVGLIANEAQEVMPEMVGVTEKKFDPKDDHMTEILTLDATALIYALVNSVKELKAELDVLKAGTAP